MRRNVIDDLNLLNHLHRYIDMRQNVIYHLNLLNHLHRCIDVRRNVIDDLNLLNHLHRYIDICRNVIDDLKTTKKKRNLMSCFQKSLSLASKLTHFSPVSHFDTP